MIDVKYRWIGSLFGSENTQNQTSGTCRELTDPAPVAEHPQNPLRITLRSSVYLVLLGILSWFVSKSHGTSPGSPILGDFQAQMMS